jgi:hypothetical protein
MMQKRFWLVAVLLFVCGLAFAADAPKTLSVHTFQFRFKDADKAAAVIKPLMSNDGSVAMQPGSNSLVVTDRPENLKAITAALAQFDTAALPFRLSVRLVSAAHVDGSGGRVPDELRDVAGKLAVLRYNSFENLGDAEFGGKEGDPGVVELKSGYRADFHLGEYDPSSDTIKVSDFRLSKLQGAQNDQLTALLKTSLNLKVGQTVILGASKVPQSQRALMIVVAVKR